MIALTLEGFKKVRWRDIPIGEPFVIMKYTLTELTKLGDGPNALRLEDEVLVDGDEKTLHFVREVDLTDTSSSRVDE